jgi:probable phosphoglycerate mutase
VPLTVLGREQAGALAARLAAITRPERIVASPFARARETAAILAAHLQLVVETDAALRERDYGDLAGRSYDTPREGFDRKRFWVWRPPGGETLEEAAQRGGAALDRLAHEVPHGDVAVVSHGALMVALWWHVTGEWRRGGAVPNAAVVVASHTDGRWQGAELVDGGRA